MTWLLLLAHQMQNNLIELGVKASLELAVIYTEATQTRVTAQP